MRLAHVQERNAPAGSPWRLAASLDPAGSSWLLLEIARRRAVVDQPNLAHDSALHRVHVTTLDDHLARGLRVEALGELVERFVARDADDDAVLDAADLVFGRPVLDPPSFRDFYAFERHVRTMWERRGQENPEAWYRLPIFYFSNTSELRGPGEAVWAPAGSVELDYELEVGALVHPPAVNLSEAAAEEAIGGYFVLNDWSARDLQRDESAVRLGPAKGKDFATTLGPWLVTADEIAFARAGKGYDLAATATINGEVISRGTWRDIHFSFGDMVERAAADVQLRAGDVLGSGTVGGCCLLEVKDESGFGRYLQPGDELRLKVDRLGALTTPVVGRP